MACFSVRYLYPNVNSGCLGSIKGPSKRSSKHRFASELSTLQLKIRTYSELTKNKRQIIALIWGFSPLTGVNNFPTIE
jgi:hypothetical protein